MGLQDATLEAHFLVIRLGDDAPEGEWYVTSSSCPARRQISSDAIDDVIFRQDLDLGVGVGVGDFFGKCQI